MQNEYAFNLAALAFTLEENDVISLSLRNSLAQASLFFHAQDNNYFVFEHKGEFKCFVLETHMTFPESLEYEAQVLCVYTYDNLRQALHCCVNSYDVDARSDDASSEAFNALYRKDYDQVSL